MGTVDTIKALFTYGIAVIVVVGGGAGIYVSRNDPGATDTVAILAGFVGSALTFVFNSEVQTRTARQSDTATHTGANVQRSSGTNGGSH